MINSRRLALALVGASSFVSAVEPVDPNKPCPCGFAVNGSDTVFTDMVETDFLHLTNITDAIDWQVQEYNVTRKNARGPFGKLAAPENVVANPLQDQYSWNGSSVLGGDPGMQMWVRGVPVEGMVGMGEIAALRDDMLYGTFRVGMKLTGVRGTCGAFFWFRNDSEEIDMEFLSRQFHNSEDMVNLVLQTPASLEAGYDASGTPNFAVVPLPFNPDGGYHEYRFDWTPGKVSFYADGKWLHEMTLNTPDSPGRMILNHWSNGDPAWSGGPPNSDAVLTVSYVKAYFNSSNPKRQEAHAKNCTGFDSYSKVCLLPQQNFAPDPNSENGNKTAATPFFTRLGDDVWFAVQDGIYNNGSHLNATDAVTSDASCFLRSLFLILWGPVVVIVMMAVY